MTPHRKQQTAPRVLPFERLWLRPLSFESIELVKVLFAYTRYPKTRDTSAQGSLRPAWELMRSSIDQIHRFIQVHRRLRQPSCEQSAPSGPQTSSQAPKCVYKKNWILSWAEPAKLVVVCHLRQFSALSFSDSPLLCRCSAWSGLESRRCWGIFYIRKLTSFPCSRFPTDSYFYS